VQLFAIGIGEVDEVRVEMLISPALAKVLDKLAENMHDSLSKVIAPRCIFYHHIELELRMHPSTKAPH
jgi:hypothetical protein